MKTYAYVRFGAASQCPRYVDECEILDYPVMSLGLIEEIASQLADVQLDGVILVMPFAGGAQFGRTGFITDDLIASMREMPLGSDQAKQIVHRLQEFGELDAFAALLKAFDCVIAKMPKVQVVSCFSTPKGLIPVSIQNQGKKKKFVCSHQKIDAAFEAVTSGENKMTALHGFLKTVVDAQAPRLDGERLMTTLHLTTEPLEVAPEQSVDWRLEAKTFSVFLPHPIIAECAEIVTLWAFAMWYDGKVLTPHIEVSAYAHQMPAIEIAIHAPYLIGPVINGALNEIEL